VKSRLILMCSVIVISLLLVACSPALKQVSVEVSYDDFMKVQPIFGFY